MWRREVYVDLRVIKMKSLKILLDNMIFTLL